VWKNQPGTQSVRNPEPVMQTVQVCVRNEPAEAGGTVAGEVGVNV